MKLLERALLDLGLSEGEAKLYIAALSRGVGTVQELASSAEVKRTSAYSLLASLQRKGLIRQTVRGSKKRYSVESPIYLERMLDERKRSLQQVLPDFLTLYNQQESQSLVRYYEGFAGVKNIYYSLIKIAAPLDFYYVIGNTSMWIDSDPDFFYEFIAKRANLYRSIRLMTHDCEMSREHRRHQKKWNMQIKLLPESVSISTEFIVTPQRMIIHQVMPPFTATVIESPSVVAMQKEFFENFWKMQP